MMTEAEWLECEEPSRMKNFLTRRGESEILSGTPFPKRPSDRKLRLFIWACREGAEPGEPWSNPLTTESDISLALDDWCGRGMQYVRNLSFIARADALRDIVGNPFLDIPKLYRLAKLDDSGWSGLKSVPDVPWLTQQAIDIAHIAYEEKKDGQALDNVSLSVLADCLEEAGCPTEKRREGPLLPYWVCSECESRVDLVSQYREGEVKMQYRCSEHGFRCANTGIKGTKTQVSSFPLLAHLRSPGPHYKGCWAVDLILGKE